MTLPAIDPRRAQSPPSIPTGERPQQWEAERSARAQVRDLLGTVPTGFVLFEDLGLPKPSRATVEHLVVGPRNVWAVTTYVLFEPVTFGSGRNADTLWSGRTPLRAMLEAADWEASAIGELIGVTVEPVVCLVAPDLPEASFDFHGIRITGPSALMQQVRSSTAEFIDVARVAATVTDEFGVLPAAGTAVPTLGVPSVPLRHRKSHAPRRRRTIGARLHAVRTIGAVRATVALAVVVALLIFLPRIIGLWNSVATEGADRLNEVIDGATPDAPMPASPPTPVRYELTCPTPGAGWTIEWAWPGPLPAGVAGYSIRTRVGEAPPVVHSLLPWSEPGSPPPPVRIAPTGRTTVFTDHRGADGDIIATTSATLAAPVETC